MDVQHSLYTFPISHHNQDQNLGIYFQDRTHTFLPMQKKNVPSQPIAVSRWRNGFLRYILPRNEDWFDNCSNPSFPRKAGKRFLLFFYLVRRLDTKDILMYYGFFFSFVRIIFQFHFLNSSSMFVKLYLPHWFDTTKRMPSALVRIKSSIIT